VAIGTIASLRGSGFGFIARDDGGSDGDAVFFQRSAVGGDGFDRLRAGQRVRFDLESGSGDPALRRAINVEPVGEDPWWD
jgi:cold shock CspA family protein